MHYIAKFIEIIVQVHIVLQGSLDVNLRILSYLL